MLNTEATEDPAPIGLAKRMKGAGDNGNAKQQACGMVCIIVTGVAFIFLIMIFSSFNRLTETEQMLVKPTTDPWYVLNGPGRYWVWGPIEDERREALILKDGQYAVVRHQTRGSKRIYNQAGIRFLGAYEILDRVEDAEVLTELDYLIVTDRKTGDKQVIQGPTRYLPCQLPEGDGENAGTQCAEYDIGPKTATRVVTDDTALLVKSTQTGQLRLVTEIGPFFPTPFEQVIEERSLIRVTEYETIVVERADGSYDIKAGQLTCGFTSGTSGCPAGCAQNTTAGYESCTGTPSGGGTSFFLQPYTSVVTLSWTIGSDVETTTSTGGRVRQSLQKIDTRVQQLFFEFDDVRTADNIEFEVEGTIFWQVGDVQQLLAGTEDPTGDIWHRLRAKIAHAAGAYTYATFLSGLKNMTDVITEKEKTPNALGGYKDFYDTRGVILHDIELIEVELTDEELERNIVDAMAMEAIDRINRVEQEISEAEVAVVALNGAHQIEVARADNERTLEDLTAANTLAAEMHAQTLQIAQQENAQTLALNELNNSLTLENTRLDYLTSVQTNAKKEAETTGSVKGVALANEVKEFFDGVETIVTGTDTEKQSAKTDMFNLYQDYKSKDTTSENLASGQAKLFLSPDGANLNLGSPLTFDGTAQDYFG